MHACIYRMWDLKTGKLKHIWKGHTGDVSSISLSACERKMASCSEDQTVRCVGEPGIKHCHRVSSTQDRFVGGAAAPSFEYMHWRSELAGASPKRIRT
eukprot:scaffold44440_cov19-Tisochrysis_lutea.AAC.3